MDTNEPRGLRNNNPLNIRHGQSRWQGMDTEQRDREFVCYMNKDYGCRAAWKLMETYYWNFKKKGIPFCLRNILHRWAPIADGNNTEGYIRKVSMMTSIGGFERLQEPGTKEGYPKMRQILMAMTCVENGIKPDEVPMKHFDKGFALAFPEVKLG